MQTSSLRTRALSPHNAASDAASPEASSAPSLSILLAAYDRMAWVSEMARTYDANRDICTYVHSTSRGHEAIQLAAGLQLTAADFIYPYYRDEAMLLGMGLSPYELMLQLLARADDPFSGGRTYYAHPSLRRPDLPQIPHQSSATGMQAIPATGAAHGLKYRESQGLLNASGAMPIVLCSLGDGSITEGEVSEAFQMAVLHRLPILYLVQDNDWGISATGPEMRAMNATSFAKGFPGLEARTVEGHDFFASWKAVTEAISIVRTERRPVLLHARVPLLGHHTSGVRREWYRPESELAEALTRDPYPLLRSRLRSIGVSDMLLESIDLRAAQTVANAFDRARAAAEPEPESLTDHIYAPTPITAEAGERAPSTPDNGGGTEVVMVDAALHAMDELMARHPEALLYGQDVGERLGGVFREAATLGKKYGQQRVFNTPIQEAYIIGSTAGMSAVGCKPVVEVQFADYIWPGLNQLFTEVARSCYLTMGKWPVQALIRVPIGAYGSGGPYHSSSVESVLLNIRGVKVVYPSNAADFKGLFKAAFYDPNPVVMLEHKGLYWSKVPGTSGARMLEPDADYIIPLGQARIHQSASDERIANGESCAVITYGMGVYWAQNACTFGAESIADQVEILDLRTLEPLDWPAIEAAVARHGKVLVLTEEPLENSFAEALSGRIARRCFAQLDAPVAALGSQQTPAIPLNAGLERAYLPSAEKVRAALSALLSY